MPVTRLGVNISAILGHCPSPHGREKRKKENGCCSMEARYCSQCGSVLPQNAAFCASCGSRVSGSSRPESDKASAGPLLLLIAFVVVGSTAAFFVVKFGVLRNWTDPAAAHSASQEEHHHHEEPLKESEVITALKQRTKSGDPLAWLELAEQQIREAGSDTRHLVEAASSLEHHLELVPNNLYARRFLGTVYYDLRMPERALQQYSIYLQDVPQDVNVRNDYALQLLALDRGREAEDQFLTVLEQFPDHYYATFNLAVAYQQLGEEDKAEEYRRKAEEIDSRVGKKMAPAINHPRLPETFQQAQTGSKPGASAADPVADLEAFFRGHAIIGPKMVNLAEKDNRLTLNLRDFPMEAMPPFARKKFDTTVHDALAPFPAGTVLEIRDAQTGNVLADYERGE